MKPALLAALAAGLLTLAACGGPPPAKRAKSSSARGAGKTPITVVPPQEEDEVDGEGKKWKGWRYTGQRDDCYYVVKRKCYTERKKACKAAGCSTHDCRIDGVGPSRVSCEK